MEILEEGKYHVIVAGWPFSEYRLQKRSVPEKVVEVIKVLRRELSIADSKLPTEYILALRNIIKMGKDREKVTNALKELFSDLNDPDYWAIYTYSRAYGFHDIDFLLIDENLEEVMVNGFEEPVYVFHNRLGMLKTNIKLSQQEMKEIVKRISEIAGRSVGERNPLLDASLPDGSRVNVALPPVSPRGPAVTIRKFRKKFFHIPELLRIGTLSTDLAAFLWLCIEGMGIAPRNIIVAGGAGAGKTTTLNALLDFIPLDQRIITVEDTRELDLSYRENWVPLVTRTGTRDVPEVTMDDLLRNALRMRPDRIILGEVRGPEAETLFIAMDIGHQGTMGTLHANSPREALLRLKSPPMNVPEPLLPLAHIIVVQHRIRRGKKTIRRVVEVAELTKMEEKTLVGDLYRWDPHTDVIKRTDIPSHTLDELAHILNISKQEIWEELNNRIAVLQWAQEHVRTREEFVKLVNAYYTSKEDVLDALRKNTM